VPRLFESGFCIIGVSGRPGVPLTPVRLAFAALLCQFALRKRRTAQRTGGRTQRQPDRARHVQRVDGHTATGRRPEVSSSYILKLYVTGKTPRTERAVANLRRICNEDLKGKYELQIIDVLENPQLAEDEKILATPTLIKRLPPPLRRVIGDLSDKEKVLLGLDVWPEMSDESDTADTDESASGEKESQ
jgi:circadian clock protein KaiB